MHERRALYVRLPLPAAEKLDEAAFHLKVPKQDLVADLLEAHLPHAGSRRVVVESMEDTMTVGHHSFVPTTAPDVLTLDEAAELLRADAATVAVMAENGKVPGRKLGDEWRFNREALLHWLAGDDNEES